MLTAFLTRSSSSLLDPFHHTHGGTPSDAAIEQLGLARSIIADLNTSSHDLGDDELQLGHRDLDSSLYRSEPASIRGASIRTWR